MTALQTETLPFHRKAQDVAQNVRASEGAGEMAGWLRMLTALSENPGLVLRSSEPPNTESGDLQLPVAPPTQIKGQTPLVPRYSTQMHVYVQLKKKSCFKNEELISKHNCLNIKRDTRKPHRSLILHQLYSILMLISVRWTQGKCRNSYR